ncbi:kinase-like domain-containing protein [Mycena leptocephala]|nr:kinase-like domain-containing protein [Mycena leptocephala]
MEQLNKLFHDNKESYTKVLAHRGDSAQWLLDLLQDLLDYDSNVASVNRRRIFKALLRLSADSELHPRCCALPPLEHERHMAGGAFGDVYKGLFGGQNVAVKIMRVFEQSEIDILIKDFGREALIWRQLCHPNILPFYGLYYYKERLCLVSPWMESGHIRAFLNKEKYCFDCLLSLILDVALGLEYLHANGVVHGDLKGDNIFVTPSFRACIADFGFSSITMSLSSIQFTSSSKSTQGGTTRYQAPEIHQGGYNDYRVDVYAFACLVYEMLTGTAPFPDLYTDVAVAMAVLQGERPSRPLLLPGAPVMDGLWNLLQMCWEQNPQNRPTASQIVGRLMGDGIQATKTPSTTDWDETFTSRFRRRFLAQQPLPSVLEFEQIVFHSG